MIDDSALIHGKVYDPQKAHEYYLRTRQLKGRKPGVSKPSASQVARVSPIQGVKPNRAYTRSRQEELQAQKEALKKRLEHLREVLADLVEKAKKRSHSDPNKKTSDSKDTAPETQVDKADRNSAEKDRKPLTAKQKSDKARKAKEEYEKEHPNTLSQDVDILREQVKDIKAKIEKAMADAQDRRTKAGQNKTKSGSTTDNTSGPKGR